MSVVAHFTVPATQFVLGELLEVEDEPQIRLESIIPTGDLVVPYFWVDNDHADAVRVALEGSDIVDEVTIVDSSRSETLFRVAWASDVDGLFGLIRDTDAALLEAEGLGDDWVFRMRFPERESLSEFYQDCTEEGLTVTLKQVHAAFSSADPGSFGLTEPQKEVLLVALEKGYFEVPREINLAELAADFGISDTAVSQRIRRGMKTLLTRTLASRETGSDRDGE